MLSAVSSCGVASHQRCDVDFVDGVCAHHGEHTTAALHHHVSRHVSCGCAQPRARRCSGQRALTVGQQESAAHVVRQPPESHLSDVPVAGKETAHQLQTKHLPQRQQGEQTMFNALKDGVKGMANIYYRSNAP